METDKSLKEKTLEELIKELQNTIDQLEKGETSLEQSFRLYQDGMLMLKACNEKIDAVEKKMIQLQEEQNSGE